MKSILTTILVVMVMSCRNDNVATSIDLNGKWVDVNTNTDTLTFGMFGGEESMILGRGKEMRNGFMQPKYGSGPYHYQLLTDDKISLRWTLSSNSNYNDYHFRQNAGQITIENFFDTTTSGTMLTFRKID